MPAKPETGTGQSQTEDNRYDAFVSYSRSDKGFAERLARGLERFKPPSGIGLEAKRIDVFRDQEDLVGSDYHKSIEKSLHAARKLIVICTPAAARSEFVDDEIRRFLSARSTNDVIPVLAAGLPNNEAKSAPNEAAFSRALLEKVATPLAIDYRGFDQRKGKIDRGRFRDAWYSLLARIYDRERAEIEQRDEARKRRQRQIWASTAAVLIVVLTGLGGYALHQRELAQQNLQEAEANDRAAQENAREARANERTARVNRVGALTALSFSEVEAGRGATATRLSLSALRIARTLEMTPMGGSSVLPSVWSALYASALANHERAICRGQGGDVTTAAFSPDGTRVVTVSVDSAARVWAADCRGEPIVLRGHEEEVRTAAFSADGTRVVTASLDGSARIWAVEGGGEPVVLRGHARSGSYRRFQPRWNTRGDGLLG